MDREVGEIGWPAYCKLRQYAAANILTLGQRAKREREFRQEGTVLKSIILIVAAILCSACGHTSAVHGEELNYKRIEYFETVFQPVSTACDRAGGFMIYEDARHAAGRHIGLSYIEMRLAVARGCAGI